ncbi:CLUMA_CG001341, isoform A [Clunio marinus]|uniref:CLUMA_CG001341, isoform A n=1 Tax=Clunio marinus TaxID=568069 RepID=A0A1J1HHN3_9DIPT|nr:CLUMA_CG001341, isoform A [Clunio marinus]
MNIEPESCSPCPSVKRKIFLNRGLSRHSSICVSSSSLRQQINVRVNIVANTQQEDDELSEKKYT